MAIKNASVLVIARLTFREASRRWVLWVALIMGVLFLIVYALGFNEIHKEAVRNPMPTGQIGLSEIYNFLLMAGLYVVNFLTAIMTVLTSVDTLSGEIASGTVHTLVSKPLRRWEIVMGKWLGFAAMLELYLLLMGGGVMGVVYGMTGYAAHHALIGLGLMALSILLLLSVSLLGGAVLSTLTNGVLVFGLYGVAFIGGWIEQFGSFLHNTSAVNVGVVCSLIMPSEAIWKRASYEMQSPLVSAFGGMSPFSAPSVPSQAMILYAIFYMAVALGLAMQRFGKRDL
jgi:ABC-type transport system involved in multi-copper enzyme maturation permease subunit